MTMEPASEYNVASTRAHSGKLHGVEVRQPGVENRADVLNRSDDSIQVRQRRHKVGEDVPCRASDLGLTWRPLPDGLDGAAPPPAPPDGGVATPPIPPSFCCSSFWIAASAIRRPPITIQPSGFHMLARAWLTSSAMPIAATAAVRMWLIAVRTNWSKISSQLPVPVSHMLPMDTAIFSNALPISSAAFIHLSRSRSA